MINGFVLLPSVGALAMFFEHFAEVLYLFWCGENLW
jgi:hypothetical protein